MKWKSFLSLAARLPSESWGYDSHLDFDPRSSKNTIEKVLDFGLPLIDQIPPCREVLDRHINGWAPRVQNCKELRLGFVLLPPCFGDLECHPLDFTMITDQEGFSLPRSKMSSERNKGFYYRETRE
nr:hypothetical protein Iba_chr13cCG9090 [Ipomoea batatas]GMD86776.1 hypothetical protein Iba_scaffold53221CG0010 [Ipomoea batatas]